MGSTRRRVEISRLIRTKAFKRGYFLVRLFMGGKEKNTMLHARDETLDNIKAFPSFLKLQVMKGRISN